MKTSFQLLLPLLVLSTLPAVVQAQFNYTDNGDGTATITKYTGSGGDVIIPSMTNGLSLTSIGDYAFYSCFSLTSVMIGTNVTSIGDGAFSLCTGLNAITVDALNTAYSSVDGVLFDKSQTALIQYPGGKAESDYTIPNGVANIGTGAFFDCTLTNVTIPDSLTNIGDYAFDDCVSLTSVTIGDSVTNIGNYAFWYCTDLTSIRIGTNVTRIGDDAFLNCTSLTNVTIPNSVISIGDYAFTSCTNLTSVTIGANVTSLGDGAFASCTGLKAITVDALNSVYSSVDEVLFTKNQTTLIQYPWAKAGSYAVPTGVTSIGPLAFIECSGLTGVTIPNSVTEIGDSAFAICTSLTNLTIGNSVTNIGDSAFVGCSSLTNFSIPNSVTSMRDYAFSGCTSLTSVTIGDSVTNIGNSAFAGCSNLSGITIPDSVTSIDYGAFSDCTSLASIMIPNSVTSIEGYAFSGCSNLTSVTVPSSVTSIGDSVFQDCASLTAVYFEGNAPTVDQYVFYGASNPTVYYLPGTTGWSWWTFGYPIVLWNPQVQTSDASFGVRTNRFGFTITGTSNLVVVIEACTNLANPIWSPVGTNTLAAGSSYFSDSQWTNYPVRFYRIWDPMAAVSSTVPWNAQVQTSGASFGVRTNRFGFAITGTSGLVVVVEACTNLANRIWAPVGTNALTGGSSYFSDPQWTNYPARFYRIRSP